MVQTWKTVRVFISSTFRDMHAERDHLVRFVFPELRERCAKRQLHLVDVDLRWGVTEEEAERKILEICLDEIERCRPFFIGMLGERYGWVPPKYDVPDEKHYNWVREFEPGHSITAMEIYHGVLRNPDMKMRAIFYFRDPAFLSKVPEEHKAVFLPESEDAAEKLKKLKDDIRKNCPVVDYSCAFGGIGEDGKVMLTGLDAFGKQVLEDLWSAIDQEFPESKPPLDELAIERAYHEAFIEGRCQRFIGRRDLLEQMTAYADSENNVPLVITGAPGCGKSALLANFARAYATAHSDVFVLPHFIGVSPGSTDIRRTLLRLCRELAQRFGITDEIPEDYEKLRGVFTKFLEQAASQGKVLLLLDALNQLDDSYHAHTLNWLPYTLPKNLRFIVSTLEGDCLDALRRCRPVPPEITMEPMEPENRKQIIRQTLWDYRKRLDERPEKDQMGLLLSKGESDNPLYLIVACEELRVFGGFEQLTERIKSLPSDMPMLFEQVLERLEHDHGKELAKSALSLLECSRYGLLETEMLEMLRREGEEQLPRAIWARLYRSLQFYLRPPGESGEGMLDFFHRQLAKAVRERYLKHEEEEIAGHRRLAEYFKRKADPTGDAVWKGDYPRGLSELTYHQTQGKMWTELEATLCDLKFIEAKCINGMTYNLVDEYSIALTEKEIPKENRGIIEIFALFVRARSHILVSRHDLLVQEAFNFASSGTVLRQAEQLLQDPLRIRPWLRLTNRPLEVRDLTKGSYPKLLNEHKGRVAVAALTPDGQIAVTGGGVLSYGSLVSILSDFDVVAGIGVWDLETKECLKMMKVRVNSLAITHDGRIVTGGYEVKVWDMETGACLQTLDTNGAGTVVVMPDGRRIVTGGNEVKVWDIETGSCIKTLNDHVRALAVTPDGHKIVTGRLDGTVNIWDIATGECSKTFEGHKEHIYAVAVTPDGRRVLTGSRDKTIKIWDIETGTCIRTLEGHKSWVISIAVTSDGRVVSGSDYGEVWVWDIETGVCLQTLEELKHTVMKTYPTDIDDYIKNPTNIDDYIKKTVEALREAVMAIAVTSNNRQVVTVNDKGIVKIWDIDTGACLKTLDSHFKEVTTIAVTPDFRRLVIGGVIFSKSVGEVKVWDIKTGACTKTLEGHSKPVFVAAVTPNGRKVVTGSYDNTIKIWDLETGACLKTLEGHTNYVKALAVTSDGHKIISGSDDKTVKIWDLKTGVCLRTLEGHKRNVIAVAVMPDCCKVLTRGREIIGIDDVGEIKVWDLATGACLQTFEGNKRWVSAVTVTPDGRYILTAENGTGTGDKSVIRIWDMETGAYLKTLEVHTEWVRAIAVMPDGRKVVSGSYDKTLKVWDISTGSCLKTLEGHIDDVRSLAVTSDGHKVVSGSRDNTVKVWDIETGTCLKTLEGHEKWVSSVAVTADGHRVVTGSNDRTTKVWDIETGECLKTLEGHTDNVTALAVTADGHRVVTGSEDKTIKVWDIETGTCLKTLEGHTGTVNALSVTSDGRRVVTGSEDKTIKVWDIETGTCLKTLEGHTGAINALSVTPDGRKVVSESEDETVRVWDLEREVCLMTLKSDVCKIGVATWTPDDRKLVMRGQWGDEPCQVKVWDMETWACLQTLEGYSSHSKTVAAASVAVTPDGGKVVMAEDNILNVWDLATGTHLPLLKGFTLVDDMAITSDCQRVVTKGEDKTIKVWDMATGKELACFYAENDIVTYAIDFVGRGIVVGDSIGRVYLLVLENVLPGSPVITARHLSDYPRWQFWRHNFAIGCPLCRTWSEIPASALGTEISCLHCGKHIKLNPFTINADWRLVAKAWRGEKD